MLGKSLLTHLLHTKVEDIVDTYGLPGKTEQTITSDESLETELESVRKQGYALDVSLRVDMRNLMLELRYQFSTSFLFISHNLSNARYLIKKMDGRIGILYLGEVVEIGPVDEVLENPQHPYSKILKWATPSLETDDTEVEEPPIRDIDIPDPVDPPSGCRFHTRCPEARETCTRQKPSLRVPDSDVSVTLPASCFRVYRNSHEYWNRTPLEDEEHPIEAD